MSGTDSRLSAERLEDLDLVRLDEDVRTLSRDELARHFAAESSGRIIISRLIRNVIWNAYERIRAGTASAIEGNLRTFWYRWVKPVLAHIPDDDQALTDPYDVMLSEFREMVLEDKLFRYADFDFTDENWENRRIGTDRAEVLVFSEKTGYIRVLREFYEEYGVSVLALGGAPSALTSEYTARHILEKLEAQGRDGETVRLIGIVDYDPAGAIIARSFQGQLADVGLPDTTLQTVIHPRHYGNEEIEMFKYRLSSRWKTRREKWLERTGGIDGERYGLEAESMPLERLRSLVNELVIQ